MNRDAAVFASTWRISPDRTLSLDLPHLMGVLNVTPDSFSDGGDHLDPTLAVDAALRMIADGASIIDIGGESTRPGAQRVDAEEQKRRTLPVIEQLRAKTDVPISIDTTLASVARAALDAGATIINDVAAGREDGAILELAAERGCGLILMHRRARPEADSFSHEYRDKPRYDDVVEEVAAFLRERAEAVQRAGLAAECICLDPGLGFGKTVEQNFELIAHMDALCALGYPVLCAASRKSFIGAVTDVESPADRVIGSTAVSVSCLQSGVRLFRVHDVAAHREAIAVAEAIRTAGAVPARGG